MKKLPCSDLNLIVVHVFQNRSQRQLLDGPSADLASARRFGYNFRFSGFSKRYSLDDFLSKLYTRSNGKSERCYIGRSLTRPATPNGPRTRRDQMFVDWDRCSMDVGQILHKILNLFMCFETAAPQPHNPTIPTHNTQPTTYNTQNLMHETHNTQYKQIWAHRDTHMRADTHEHIARPSAHRRVQIHDISVYLGFFDKWPRLYSPCFKTHVVSKKTGVANYTSDPPRFDFHGFIDGLERHPKTMIFRYQPK